MRRSIVVIIFVLLTVGIVTAGLLWKTSTSESTPTATEAACQMVNAYSTPNLQVELAIDSLYEGLPQMQTPIAMVATQEKPFTVGCIPAGD